MKAAPLPWVQIQQPVVPHYRLALFDSLSARLSERLLVCASRTALDGPNSVDDPRPYLDLDHDCVGLMRGRMYWQRKLRLVDTLGRGDVAVICGNPRYLSTLRFAHHARRRGLGLVWWGHGWSPTSTRIGARIRHGMMAQVDCVLTYTDDEAEQLRRILPSRVAVVGAQNAIDQTPIRQARAAWSEAKLRDFRASENIEGRRVLLFCGRLRTNPATGVDLLIKALAALTTQDTSYLAVIIGEGEDRVRLQALVEQHNLTEHVRWLGALYEETTLAPWFLSAVCFVYPGPIGLSILHAMGYGLPVITHNDRRRHNPEIAALRHEWNGLEFADGQAEQLAQQIARLGRDPDTRDRLARNADATVAQHFSLAVMTDRFLAAIDIARNNSIRGVAP